MVSQGLAMEGSSAMNEKVLDIVLVYAFHFWQILLALLAL